MSDSSNPTAGADSQDALVRPGDVVIAHLQCGHAVWGEVQWIKDDICMIGGVFEMFMPGAVVLDACARVITYPGPKPLETQREWLLRTAFPLRPNAHRERPAEGGER